MRLLLTLFYLAFLAAPALAGFIGPVDGAEAETAAKARTLPDKAPVILTGNIVSRLPAAPDKYKFHDSTGDILLAIREDVFKSREITPLTRIRVMGRVEKAFFVPVEIEVTSLEVLRLE